jgi:LPXTG-motif cell wall-anchored protein
VASPDAPPAVTDQGITGGPLDSPPTTSVPSLPRTGADTGTAALLGLAAVVLGVLLVLAAHEPARGRHQRPWARSRSATA